MPPGLLSRFRITPVAAGALLALGGCGESITRPLPPGDVTLSAGGTFTCQLGDLGAAQCWGANWWGQLGDDTSERCDLNSPCSRAPKQVAAPLRFVSITAGVASTPFSGHACGLTDDHRIFCWGVDKTQLGEERDSSEICISINGLVGQACSREPLAVAPDREFTAVAAGDFHNCAVAVEGEILCWGSDDNGQLGSAATEICGPLDLPCSFAPVKVAANAFFTSVVSGSVHSCALASDGLAHCWGNNDSRQLGHPAVFGQHIPAVTTLRRVFVALTAGRRHTCGLDEEGGAYCWGNNEQGQLGNGSALPSSPEARVRTSLHFIQLSAGWNHTCGLTVEGLAYCWGDNTFGQLGTITQELADRDLCPSAGSCALLPQRVETSLRFQQLSAGGVHTCGVTTSVLTYCWGDNSFGQLGGGAAPRSLIPVRVGS